MNKPTSGRSLQDAKRQIAQKSKDFEARLMKAKNAFEQVIILNEMQELIDAEIFAWTNLVTEDEDTQENTSDELMNEAAVHVADLNDFVIKLNAHRAALMPDALKIQRAMINSHQLTAPKLSEN